MRPRSGCMHAPWKPTMLGCLRCRMMPSSFPRFTKDLVETSPLGIFTATGVPTKSPWTTSPKLPEPSILEVRRTCSVSTSHFCRLPAAATERSADLHSNASTLSSSSMPSSLLRSNTWSEAFDDTRESPSVTALTCERVSRSTQVEELDNACSNLNSVATRPFRSKSKAVNNFRWVASMFRVPTIAKSVKEASESSDHSSTSDESPIMK
mmetsp:Transcript_77637/g.216972  ORF Transcript_77637/g.216972 Transcript_77637/m.216972 type:complete len:209 (+) Transcript_77637:905-1531(+)